jgi:hypothetical protein
MLPLMDEIPYIFFLCTVFSIIKKHESETIFQFNTCFSKFYNQIPNKNRPNEVAALIYYLEAFGHLMVFLVFFSGIKTLKIWRNHKLPLSS